MGFEFLNCGAASVGEIKAKILVLSNELIKPKFLLRTVPIKYGGFCAKLGQCGKSRSLQKLL